MPNFPPNYANRQGSAGNPPPIPKPNPVTPTPAAAAPPTKIPVVPYGAPASPVPPSSAAAGPMRYPNTAWNAKQDFIQFDAYEYGKKNFKTDSVAGFENRSFGTSKGTVILPIQGKIVDGNTVDWGEATMDPLQLIFAKLSLASIESAPTLAPGKSRPGFGAAFKPLKDYVAGKNSPELSNFLNNYLAGKAASAQGLNSRLTGAVANPNLELLFNGPALRAFQFNFMMSARDKDEATQIRKIIRFFKKNMAVKATETNVFLKSPNIFEIKYVTPGLKDHPSINRIKKCALQSLSIDYTPAGTYSTYDDPKKTMTMYSMTMQFMELEPVFLKDYDGIPTDEIGF